MASDRVGLSSAPRAHFPTRPSPPSATRDPIAYASWRTCSRGRGRRPSNRASCRIENALEGTVSATIDGLVFAHDLVILQEIVLPIHLHLLARPGIALAQVKSVRSYVHALAQVRGIPPPAP